MRVWCVLTVLAVANAAPQTDLSEKELCTCTSKPLPGFRDASCACAVSKSKSIYDSVLSLGNLLSTSTSVKLTPVTDETCVCDVNGLKGFSGATCTCEARMVPCPTHTTGHPDCWPVDGYKGNVRWDQAAEDYVLEDPQTGAALEKFEVVECGDVGASGSWPYCTCIAGMDGSFQWNSQQFFWTNNCTAVRCPDFADGAPSCKCSTGFVDTHNDALVWDSASKEWNGSCTKVHCPEATFMGSHPKCPCKKGYTGASVFESGSYTHNCSLASCVMNSEHEGDTCVCKSGYDNSDESPIHWDFASQQWLGECTKRDCPIHSESHPTCDCSRGYAGGFWWNSTSHHFDGTCVAVDCPNHASGDECTCDTGYIHASIDGVDDDFDFVKRVWTHSCVARGCPLGSDTTSPSECECNAPGYTGALIWANENWGSCSDQVCPLHSAMVISSDGVRSCVCDIGYEGHVLWESATSTWASTCEEAACKSTNDCNLDTFTAQCSQGYSGTVTWDSETQSWISTCSEVACPVGSSNHPQCKCSTGYSGGDRTTQLLHWEQDGDFSRYRGFCSSVANSLKSKTTCQNSNMELSCDNSLIRIVSAFFGRADTTTCASTLQSVTSCSSGCFTRHFIPDFAQVVVENALSVVHTRCDGRSSCVVPAMIETFNDPCESVQKYLTVEYECLEASQQICDELCTDVKCPANSSPNLDGTCSCDFGFSGTIDWAQHRYVGLCVPAACPLNATGLGPNCACPKGYLPSEDFLFADGQWIGHCEYQSCGPYTDNWPDCTCIDNHHFSNNVEISWEGGVGGRGFMGSCMPWPCPANAAPAGQCHCARGFASYVNGQMSTGPVWDAVMGSWAHSCQFVPCEHGSDASTHPLCACEEGYSGYPEWHVMTGTYDACVEVPCPDERNMQKVTDTAAPWAAPVTLHSCMCKHGFSGIIDFDVANQEWSGSCAQAECPAKVDCTKESEARCAKGFYGTVSWSGSSYTQGFWDHNCEDVPCPTPAEGHPQCTCPMGFAGGQIQWNDANNWTSACQDVVCPVGATKGLQGTCRCSSGYVGSIEWNSTTLLYSGNCDVQPCVENASGEPKCTCDRGFKPSVDYTFTNGHWKGTCDPVPCPPNSDHTQNCSCHTGYEGTITWNMETFDYEGVCTYVECPENSFGPDCACATGYSGIGMWDGDAWTHTCHARECPENTIQVDLHRGHACACPIRTKGIPVWTGTEWEANCIPVPCPNDSLLDVTNGSKCDCILGFAGYPVWDTSTMAFDSSCTPIPCPEGTVGLGGPLKCSCPRGQSGDCDINTTDQEFDCNCEPRDCPANAHVDLSTDLCTCNKGWGGQLEWDESRQNYTGICVKKKCAEDVPGSAGHPNCTCSTGYRGSVSWDDTNDVYIGECTEVACPAFSEKHPKCSLVTGYRYVDGNAITWSSEHEQWEGTAEAIPCPDNATGEPNCTCKTGFRDSGLSVQGQEYGGSCDPVACPGEHPGFPHCECAKGYNGTIEWDDVTTNGNWVSKCIPVTCPSNSQTPLVCTCNPGYRGVPAWNVTAQTWTHHCEKTFCPAHAENHPTCTCMSGFTGSINYSPSTGYSGQCNIVDCPAHSKRIGGYVATNSEGLVPLSQVTNSAMLMIKHVSGDIRAFVEVIGNEHWAKVIQWETEYTPDVKGFGSISTASLGTGKLSDDAINRLSLPDGSRTYMIDWDPAQKGNSSRNLFIITDLPHIDDAPSFGIIRANTRVSLNTTSPKADSVLSTYTTTHIDSTASTPVLSTATDCFLLKMGGADKFDCQTAPGQRCLSGGSTCEAGDTEFHSLRDVRVYVKLDQSLIVYQTMDDAHLTPTNLTLVDTSIPGCKCFVGYTGGFDWVDTHYQGSCMHSTCPSNANCSALMINPDNDQISYPAAKGYRGFLLWAGSGWDSSNIHPVTCPTETTGYPNCHCEYGYEGTVDWSTEFVSNSSVASYTEHCSYVECPAAMMVRGLSVTGLPKCTCPVGFTGVATWSEATQSFTGAQGCAVAHCAVQEMSKSKDLRTCSCPVGFKGSMKYDNVTQLYVGSSSCESAECPLGASCDTNPEERDCLEFYKGKYSWNDKIQEWDHDCQVVECSEHAKRRSGDSVNGCVCRRGWHPAATWVPATQSYSGCEQDITCPPNADIGVYSNETSGRMCPCPAGYFGIPIWHASQATYTHSCTRRPCPEGSAGDLCNCEIGFAGGLNWNTISQDYAGSCQIAPCPDTGVNCTFATDSKQRPQLSSLPCKQGYFGSGLWNYTAQTWEDKCTLRPCPSDQSVILDPRSAVCACRWGYEGTVTWNMLAQDYEHSCTQVDCPSGSIRLSDGYCGCPLGTSTGMNRFLSDDTWSTECQMPLTCPTNSDKAPDCVCDQGYSGKIKLNTELKRQGNFQLAAIEISSSYSGVCTEVECPANSFTNSFPSCECDNGFTGNITWDKTTQTWISTCKVAECPQFASQGPKCACDRGYVGILQFDRSNQSWTGSCSLAICPTDATAGYDGTEPTCVCDNGFRGTPRWTPGEGWKHVCEDVPCPDYSTKVVSTTSISYQRVNGFVGCHNVEGTALGFIGSPLDNFEDITEHCTGGVGSEECLKLGRDSCDRLIASGRECWGFAVANNHKIMLYNGAASDYSLCDPDNGLQHNSDFTTFKRRSATGDCRCVSGFGGGFVYSGDQYIGGCSRDVSPPNSDSDTSVTCHQGYYNASSFIWNFDTEKWEGNCVRKGCGENDNHDTFPNCACATGYAGGQHGWDYDTESWTGTCTKVECPNNTDKNHPSCKCSAGFIRNDQVANQPLAWSNDEWQDSCEAVPCPSDSSLVSGGNCKCNTGYKGHPSFSLEYGNYTVTGSGNLNSCTRVTCPSNSYELIMPNPDGTKSPTCHCSDGYQGDLTWKHSTFSWGSCSSVACPAHSNGHPYCTCDRGYAGEILWNGVNFSGKCSEMNTVAEWEAVPSEHVASASCQTIQGAATSRASVQPDPLAFVFDFAGSAATVNVLRCDVTMAKDFTKVRGSFVLNSTVGTTENIAAMAAWNSTTVSSTTHYIAFGTLYNVVDPGMEGGSEAKSYPINTPTSFIIPETPVTQTNSLRFEISQPSGVSLTIGQFALQTYSLPSDVVTWIRETNIADVP